MAGADEQERPWASPGGAPEPPPAAPAAPGPAGAPAPAPPGAGAGAWQAPAGWGAPPPPGEPAQPQWGPWGGAPAAPRPGVVPLRPLGLGELLDGGVAVVRRYPRPTLGLSAALSVVVLAAELVFVLTAVRDLLDATAAPGGIEGADPDELIGLAATGVAGGLAAFLVSALATVVLTGVLTSVVGRAVLGRPMTTQEAWAQVRPRLLPLLGLALLTYAAVGAVVAAGVVVALGLGALGGTGGAALGTLLGLAALVAGAYLWVRLALAPAVLVLENAGIRQSLRRSWSLVSRAWWRTFGVLLLTAVIGFVVAGVLQTPFSLLGGVGPLSTPTGAEVGVLALALGQVGAAIGATLVRPFTTAVRALLYVDRRMRAEGLDVSLQAAAAAPPS